ncbi:hypothetical protein [Chryseobacterium rhizosphaerae]|nr:hypothetical protein [Chryseobacterium rhizosphaerae]
MKYLYLLVHRPVWKCKGFYGRNSTGALEITDANDYYPFGMNHLKTGNSYFAQGSYKSNN